MRYKVNCRIPGYSTIYYDEKAWNQIDLTLNASEYSQFKNLIFTDGETKVFYLKPVNSKTDKTSQIRSNFSTKQV